MTPIEFERRVQHLLDRRRDPLADHRCTEFLAEHPEAIALTAWMLERCAMLPAVARRAPRVASGLRRGPWVGLAAAAAVGAFWLAMRGGAESEAATRRPAGRVLSASLEPILSRLQASPTARVRTVLLAGPGAEFEVFTEWGSR